MLSSRQYKRRVQVVVGKSGKGLLIENLRIKFEVVKDHQPSPNSATIKIYNLNDEHQSQIRNEFEEVLINAGYEGSEAVLFRGNIRHVYRYQEGNDWIVEIDCGDGDKDFRDAVVNETLAAGVGDDQLVDRVCSSFELTKKGDVDGIANSPRLRGKVVSGNSRDVLSALSHGHGCSWSIQNGRLQIVKASGVVKGEAILVNSDTGMLEAPEQDDKGIKVSSLLNPSYRVNGAIKLNNGSIKKKRAKSDSKGGQPESGDSKAAPAKLDPDGIYKVYKLTHKGDNYGQEWETLCECVSMDSSFPAGGKG